LDGIEAEKTVEVKDLGPGLGKVRRRRWLLWIVLLAYLPTMWTTQQITRSFQGSLPVFFGWLVLLVVAAAVSAAARCPRCGKHFHVNGMALLYLRKCLHCQLHIDADKKGR
jgi:predicted ferric reductase